MINIYGSIRNDKGALITGRTKLFIEETDDSGTILKSKGGTLLTPEGTGTMFIVDDWLIPQIDKVQFLNGELTVKDGEELMSPVKTEKELLIEKIERQLAELKADTGEPTEQPAE